MQADALFDAPWQMPGAIAPLAAVPAQLKRASYVSALLTHDWQFEHADDGRAYRRGREQRAALEALQREVDPDCAIWNRHCPAEFRRGRSA